MHIGFVGVFRRAEKPRQKAYTDMLGVTISGVTYCWVEGLGEKEDLSPYISLIPRGLEIHVDFDENRENWVVMFERPHYPLRLAERSGYVCWDTETGSIELPMHTPLTPEYIPLLQRELQRMSKVMQAPTPANQQRAAWGMMYIMRYVFDWQIQQAADSPAERLKRLIDEGTLGGKTLEELSQQCGYTPDHLRKLFREQFGISPKEYHNRQRMAQAMDLLTAGTLSIKEIARQTGFASMSSFSHAVTKHFGASPLVIRNRF